MRIRTCITRVARERGTTAAEVARRLRLYRSTLSAADAGRRALSLRAPGRIAEFLGCSPGELVERAAPSDPRVFRNSQLNALVLRRDASLTDGTERAWAHTVLLAWQRHYRPRR